MKTRLTIILAFLGMSVCMAQTPADSLAFVNYDWQWQKVDKGAMQTSATLDIFGASETISIVKYPASRFKTQVIHAPEQLCGATDTLAMRAGGLLACNGSYFNMRKLTPVTFVGIKGEQLGETTKGEVFRCNGLVAIKKNEHRIDILPVDTTAYNALLKKYAYVLTSGPLLRKDGKDWENTKEGGFFANRHPRTIIGKDAKGWIYYVVIDGRWKEHSKGATIEETTAIARYLNLVDALNLDGGGSSTVWTKQGGVLNHPNDNGRWDHAGCRKVPNIVVAK